MSSRTRMWANCALLVLVLGSIGLVNPYVRGDGNGYYAWLVSPVIDHDLSFANQFAHGDPLFRGLIFDEAGQVRPEATTAAGRVENQWSTGPALLWAPWFLAAHAIVLIARAFGAGVAADGYSTPYLWLCGIGTACYGLVALWLARASAIALGYGRGASTTAVLLAWTATSLPVYQYFLPFHVHALAAFSVAWFVWWWATRRPIDTSRAWIIWGALGGLMTVVYHLNAVVLLVAAWELIALARRGGIARAAAAVAVFAAGALPLWLPQLIGKAIVYGTPFTTGYHDEFFFAAPRIWQTGWSTEHGLFVWTPVVFLAVAGLVIGIRRKPAALALTVAAVFYYVVASYQNWHGQSSFGNRFFVSLTVFFVWGLAELVGRVDVGRGGPRAAVAGGALLLALWNGGLAFQWGTGLVPNRGPVDFRVVARQQVLVVPGAVWRFLRRYCTARRDVIRDVEQGDVAARPQYRLKR
jgi:hypothetical protein